MTNTEKAQAIYTTLLHDQPAILSELLLDISSEYGDGNSEILTVEDWVDYARGEDIYTIIRIAQLSSNLDINDKYIRVSIYYTGYQTGDSVLDIVDKDEAIEWITSYLEDFSYSCIDELDAKVIAKLSNTMVI